MRALIRLLLILLTTLGGTLAVAGPAFSQTSAKEPSPTGYRVDVKSVRTARDVPRASNGELLAASPDSVWLLGDRGLASIPFGEIEQVRIQRSSFGAGKVWGWSLLAGLGSGVALTLACSSVEGASCGGILPGVLATWAIVGGLSSASVESSRHLRLDRPVAEQLRPYARFPQGLPQGYVAPADSTRR